MFLIYLLGVVLFFSFLANFAFRKIFKSLSWVDKPDGIKKLHKNDIPLSGGISFIASLIFAVLIFDFFAGVNFNLSWNGFFVGDSIKQDNSLNENSDKKIDLIGNDSFEIEVIDINENSQAVVVINKKTFETELMEIYKDEFGSFQIKGNGFEANSNYVQDALLPPKVTVNINGNESTYYQKINVNVPPFFIWMLITGIILAFITLIDDLWGLSVPTRFLSQAAACLILVTQSGLYIDNLGNLFGLGFIELNPAFGVLFTIFCVIGILNAFNWIDGFNGGLTSQFLVGITAPLILLSSNNSLFIEQIYLFLLICFLPYALMNLKVMGKRFIIFMGDHGSMFCGYIVAWCLIYFAMERADYMNPITAVWIVGFVLLNAVSTIIIRIINKRSPLVSDRSHIHHSLDRLGLKGLRVSFVVLVISSTLALTGVLIEILGISELASMLLFVFVSIVFLRYRFNLENS
jgi:UDP-GlcNAc:undecaprenyl-phosphate GlcNAc-1-phosphate transferase